MSSDSRPETKPEYTDCVDVVMTHYGFGLVFGRMRDGDEPPAPVADLALSPQAMKIISLLLRKFVIQYEREVGTVILPQSVYDDLEIRDE